MGQPHSTHGGKHQLAVQVAAVRDGVVGRTGPFAVGHTRKAIALVRFAMAGRVVEPMQAKLSGAMDALDPVADAAAGMKWTEHSRLAGPGLLRRDSTIMRQGCRASDPSNRWGLAKSPASVSVTSWSGKRLGRKMSR